MPKVTRRSERSEAKLAGHKCVHTIIPWPGNLSHEPLALPSGAKEFERAREQAYESGLRLHYALDDAKASCLSWCEFKNDAQVIR